MHKISEIYISQINRKRATFVAALIFCSLIGYQIYKNGGISISVIATSLAIALLFAARHRNVWTTLIDESQWTLEPEETSLAFHFRGGCARIHGADIKKIKAKLRKEKILWFDIHYKNQVTRIQDYDGMDLLYLHAKKISGDSVQIEEIRQRFPLI
jgi:hypothetical protein